MLDSKKVVLSVVILLGAYLVDYFFIHTAENTVLDIKLGKIKGRISRSRDGRDYYEFLGLPYAEPPVGKLRFLSPKPIKGWDGVRDATNYQSKCMQIDMLTNVKGGSEDCLYLNVFSPKTSGVPSLFPVIVYLHGGHFMNGDARMFGPKYFMDADVVLVTVNYRLGSLGFLNAGNKYARGNMGLKDQVQALRWVKDNIPYFSGDPNRVTLMGHSAGASSAHLHMLSKMSSGLFHNVISASGTGVSPFVMQKDPIEQAKRLGKRLRCPVSRKIEAMVACLGQAEVQRLVETQREAVHFLRDPITMYGPTVELVDDYEAFLVQDPIDMLRTGAIINTVPWLVGATAHEGQANAAMILRNSSMIREVEQNTEEAFKKILLYKSGDIKKLKEYYFGTGEDSFIANGQEGLSKMVGDRMHVVPTHNSVLYHAKQAPVYMYHFNQPATMSYADVVYNQNGILPPVVEIGVYLAYKWVARLFGSSSGAKEVSHFDDQTFFFNIPFVPEYNPGYENYELSKDLIKLWVAFASDSKPSEFRGVSWKPVEPKPKSSFKYLEISNSPKIVNEPFEDRIKFWKSLNLR